MRGSINKKGNNNVVGREGVEFIRSRSFSVGLVGYL